MTLSIPSHTESRVALRALRLGNRSGEGYRNGRLKRGSHYRMGSWKPPRRYARAGRDRPTRGRPNRGGNPLGSRDGQDAISSRLGVPGAIAPAEGQISGRRGKTDPRAFWSPHYGIADEETVQDGFERRLARSVSRRVDGLVGRGEKAGGCGGERQIAQDLPGHRGALNDCDDLHPPAPLGTEERIHLIDLADAACPSLHGPSRCHGVDVAAHRRAGGLPRRGPNQPSARVRIQAFTERKRSR